MPLLDAVPPLIVSSVFHVHSQPVRARLQEGLEQHFPPVLVPRVFDQIYSQTEPFQLFRQLREGFGLSQLLELLYEAHKTQEFRTPPSEELQTLDMVLQQGEHSKLRLLSTGWGGKQKQLHQELTRFSEEEYRRFVQTTLRFAIVEPLACLIPGRGDIFLDLYLTSSLLKSQYLVTLVQALLAVGEVSCLARLVPYIPGQKARHLRTLEKIIDKHLDVPETFRHAVSDALAALPSPKGVKGFLYSLLSLRRRKAREDT